MLDEPVEPFQEQLAYDFDTYPRSAIQVSRGHGKTELNSVAWALWLAFRSVKPWEMLIVSGTEQQCKNIVRRIYNYAKTVPLLTEALIQDSYRDKIESALKFKTKNGCFIQSYPIKSKSILGNHVDFLIVDDVYGDESADIDSINYALQYNVSPVINRKKGQFIFCGTPKSEKDWFTMIRENPSSGFVYRRWAAVVLNDAGEWEKPLWENGFSLDELRGIKSRMSSLAWSREYMLDYVSDGARLFPSELVSFATERGLEARPVKKNANYFLGCDIALSDKERADFSAFVVLEAFEKEPLRQVGLVRLKGVPTDELLNRIKGLHKKYCFSRVLIEDVGLSKGLVDLAVKDSEIGLVCEGFKTTHLSKEDVLGKVEIAMRNGRLKVSENEVLQDELSKFGVVEKKGVQRLEGMGSHDDCVIALGLAVEAASRGNVFSYAFI